MKKLIIVTLSILAAATNAQVLNEPPVPKVPYSVPSYTTPAPPPAITFLQKDFWMEGVYCSAKREVGMPDLTIFVGSSLEHMSSPFVEACIRGLRKEAWKKVTVVGYERVPLYAESLREARTKAMFCTIKTPPQRPTIYEVRFTSFIFTGKDRELRECMDTAAEAPDQVPPPAPFMPPSSSPSINKI